MMWATGTITQVILVNHIGADLSNAQPVQPTNTAGVLLASGASASTSQYVHVGRMQLV